MIYPTIEPILLLDALYFGLTNTAIRVLIYDKVCVHTLGLDVETCVQRNLTAQESGLVVSETSRWEFYRTIVSLLPALLLMAIYAGLADRWSKKYVMLFCPTGSILSMLVFIFAAVYMPSSPAVILVASLVDGLSGGATLLNGAVYSYLVMICGRTEDRAVRIAIVDVFQLGGRAIASFVSGDVYRATGHVFVFSLGIALNLLIYLWVMLVVKNRPAGTDAKSQQYLKANVIHGLPDEGFIDTTELSSITDLNSERSSLNADCKGKDNKNNSKKSGDEASEGESILFDVANLAGSHSIETIPEVLIGVGQFNNESSRSTPIAQLSGRFACCAYVREDGWRLSKMLFLEYVRVLTRIRVERKRAHMRATLVIIGIEVMCVRIAMFGLIYLFLVHKPLSFSTSMFAYYTGTSSAVRAVCLLIVLPIFKKYFKLADTTLLLLGLCGGTISLAVFGASQWAWMAYFSLSFDLLQPMAVIAARCVAVSCVEYDEHAKLFGMISSLESLTYLIGSAIFNFWIYPATASIFPGTAILLLAGLMLIPLGLAIWLHVSIRRDEATNDSSMRSDGGCY